MPPAGLVARIEQGFVPARSASAWHRLTADLTGCAVSETKKPLVEAAFLCSSIVLSGHAFKKLLEVYRLHRQF
jgi:hypothetical protein